VIRCPKCGTSNEDDALVCRTCAALLDPPGGATETGEAPKEGTRSTGDFRSSFSLPLRDDADDASREEAPGREGAPDGERATTPPPPPASPLGDDDPLDSTGSFSAEGLDLDPNHLAAVTHHGKGRPIVSVIGFPGSGKTFLVNRWRHELMHRGDWQSYPPPEPRVPLSPEGLILTHLVPADQRRNRGYVVVDCAGESFDLAFERQHENRELEGSAVRSYLTALGLARAYVLVLEADDLIPGPHHDATKRGTVEAMMMAFHDILGGILVAKERLREQSPEELLQQGISRRELDDAFEERRRFSTPICVAFAQSDRLAGLRRDGVAIPGFDDDPYLFARRHARFLYNAVSRRFEHYRFDFISAFPGYEANDPANPAPDYHLPSYGTAALFDWVDRLLKPRLPVVGAFTRIAAGGVPTRHAVRLRRLLEPAFRRQTGKGPR